MKSHLAVWLIWFMECESKESKLYLPLFWSHHFIFILLYILCNVYISIIAQNVCNLHTIYINNFWNWVVKLLFLLKKRNQKSWRLLFYSKDKPHWDKEHLFFSLGEGGILKSGKTRICLVKLSLSYFVWRICETDQMCWYILSCHKIADNPLG